MSAVPRIGVTVTFLHPEDGGRATPAFDSPGYRPHVVGGDPEHRRAVVDEAGVATEHYLGVQFTGDGYEMLPGVEHEVRLDLVYSPTVDYSELRPGATFTIREGDRVVGVGRVLQ
jgi:hypothetical protein